MQARKSATQMFAEQQMALPEEEELAVDDPSPAEHEEAAPQVEAYAAAPIDSPKGWAPAPPPRPVPSPALSPSLKRKPEMKARYVPQSAQKTSEDLQLEKDPIQVRETGALFWRRVIVPPNAFVVHTRIGRREPVTLGLGQSFRYNPDTDTYLVVPAAMQTIGVVANCISREKQGINILAYVQWQIEDFAVAYKRLDFSNKRAPLDIVNAQLREQAEAAIKDKIATMSVEDVLTDKAPVIAELTERLKTVAEGQTDGSGRSKDGLGIKIVTVQIREALVSSTSLWEDLQAPFRHAQNQMATVSRLQMEDALHKERLATEQASRERQMRLDRDLEARRQADETLSLEQRLAEERRRQDLEEAARREDTERRAREAKLAHEARLAELALETVRLEHEDQLARRQAELDHDRSDREARWSAELERLKEALRLETERGRAEIEALRQDIRNRRGEADLTALLIQSLPALVEKLPAIDELRVYQGADQSPMLAGLQQLFDGLGPLLQSMRVPGAKGAGQ